MMNKENYPKSGYDSVLQPDITDSVSDQEVESTTRTCNVMVFNNWDTNGIQKVTFRHRYRNKKDPEDQQQRTWPSILFGDHGTPPLDVIYYTGFGTGFDYWWIEFTDAKGRTWTCKDNFYCYLTAADNGTTVTVNLNGASEKMEITMNSGGCSVSVYRRE